MEDKKSKDSFFKIVSVLYFVLMLYTLISWAFGIGNSRCPMGFYYILTSCKASGPYFGSFIFWCGLSVIFFLFSLMNISRFIKVLKKKEELDRLLYLRKMQRNILTESILVICMSFVFSTFSKEISLLIVFLIIFLYIISFIGYILERKAILTFSNKKDDKIETKRLIYVCIVNFFTLIIPLILLLLNLRFEYNYIFASDDILHYNFALPHTSRNLQVVQMFEYVFLGVLFVVSFKLTLIPTTNKKMKSYCQSIVILMIIVIFIIIQCFMVFDSSNITQFIIDCFKNHLIAIILFIMMLFLFSLQDTMMTVDPSIKIKELKKIKKLKSDPVNNDDNFTGFVFDKENL
ncbi:MAG: hypothetical protein NC087_02455 [Anaeroplasma bactoclasticum]|nr:hypothetical protein [Anaeroplasma bactoclasticum]MCM1556378.1 hypothetical protein [Anaeroplasma bactoclasticum]